MAGALLGGPFKQNVRRQIEVRSKKRSSQNLTDRDIAVQQGNTGWVRVSSGVVVEGDKDSAQRNILQGGVLSKLKKGFDQSGENSTYTKDSALGFRPLPGITQVQITNQGDAGTLNKAEVNFTVNSRSQLDEFEKLYLRPGYHVLIEYGHSVYYDNDENIISNIPSVVDFFNAPSVESVNKQIKELQIESDYNYDAYLGLIVNFSYSFNTEGGYDCSFYITSKGEILESMKIVGAGNLKNFIKKPESAAVTKATKVLESIPGGKRSETSSQDNTSAVFEILNFMYKIAGQRDPLLESLKNEFPNLGFEPADVPYYLHDVSTDEGNRAKKVYITFSTLLKIVNVMNIFLDNKNEIVKFGFNTVDKVNSKFLTYDNHFSSDPHVCLLKKTPVNERLFFGAGAEDFPKSSSNQINEDILLDISFLIKMLNEVRESDEKDQTVIDYLQKIFSHVESSLGDINNLDFYYAEIPDNDDTPTIYIIDQALHFIEDSKVTASNVLPAIGKGSVVTNLSITSKIDKSMASQASIAASSTDTNIADILTATTNAFNKGISDRFSKQKRTGTGDTVSANKPENSNDYEKIYIPEIEKAVETFVGGRSFKISDGSSLKETHRAIAVSDIIKSKNPIPGLMPYIFNLNLTGIAGLVIYQAFVIQEGILPTGYQEGVSFLITGISHNISNNEWTTDISGRTNLLSPDPEKIVKSFEKKELTPKIIDKIENFGIDKSAP